MVVCHNIQWIQKSMDINPNLYFIEQNKIWGGNSIHSTKRLLFESNRDEPFHSFSVVDPQRQILYLSQPRTRSIMKLENGSLTKLNVSGDRLRDPQGIVYDSTSQSLYICDTGNHRICLMNSRGEVTTIVGSRNRGYRDGIGTSAIFDSPTGICFGETNQILYVTDTNNHVIRRIDISQSYQTSTIGLRQQGNLQVSDGVSRTAKFKDPQDIFNYNNQVLLVCEKLGNIREINLNTGIIGTLQIPYQLKVLQTRMFSTNNTLSGFLISNNAEWYILYNSLRYKQTCSPLDKQFHHHGVYFDKYNSNRIIRQPYKFSYYSPQDPLRQRQLTNKWWDPSDLSAHRDYHQATYGNHIPYLSDSKIQDNIYDVFLYPNQKTPKLLYVELQFLRDQTNTKGYTYLVETQFGYEGRVRVKHRSFSYPKTHIIRLKKQQSGWILSFHPKLDTHQNIEFLGGKDNYFESNNKKSNSIGYWEDNSELIGNIRQWSETMNETLPRHKPLTNLYDLSCNSQNQCSYSYMKQAPECCPSGKQGNACRLMSSPTPSYNVRNCRCDNGSVSNCSVESTNRVWKHCDRCSPGYERRKSGICSQKCFCNHGISAKRDMCYSPGTEICTRCNPGYKLEKNNQCVRIPSYTGKTSQLQDKTYEVVKPLWGKNYHSWDIQRATKYPGPGWSPSPQQNTNETCFDKLGRQDKRKVIPPQKNPLFHLECWNLKSDDPCYQEIQSIIGSNVSPQSSQFRSQQCNLSVNSTSSCFKKTPCNIHNLPDNLGCKNPLEKTSTFEPLSSYSTILGNTQWILSVNNQRVNGSELELSIKDYHPGLEIKQANYLCNQSFSPLQKTQQLHVSGVNLQSCTREEVLANGKYQRNKTSNNLVTFTNKHGYVIEVQRNDPCLTSAFGTECSLNPVIKNNNRQLISCTPARIVSSSLHQTDCQKCSYWSYIDESNKQTQYDVEKAFFNFSTSSVIPVIHIRTGNISSLSSFCNNHLLLKEIIEGDFIKEKLFKKTGIKTHIQGIQPEGPDSGRYIRSFQKGIQMILSEGNEYYFEKKLILSSNYPCGNVTIPSQTQFMIRLTYCNNDHWKISSYGNQTFEIQGDIWDPQKSRHPSTTCDFDNRKHNPKQMRNISQPIQSSHLIYLKLIHNNQIIANLTNDANLQSTPIELCEQDLAFITPQLNQTNHQVRQELQTNNNIDTFGYYRKQNNQYYLINPYSPSHNQRLQTTNKHIIDLHSSSKCNQIASDTYIQSYNDECVRLNPTEINQLQESVKQECIQMWGKNIQKNGKSLFINGKWSPTSLKPNVLRGERCCRPDPQKNEHLCFIKDNNHKYAVCKDGFHLVDKNEFLLRGKQAVDHTNDSYCKSHSCKCVPNICRCTQNKPAKQGKECLIHDSDTCIDSCLRGKRLVNGKCIHNVCKCEVSYPQGKQVNNDSNWTLKGDRLTRLYPNRISSICDVHGSNSCGSCPRGFYLQGNQCIPYEGECKNGKLQTQLSRLSDNQCIRCNLGYELTRNINNTNVTTTSNSCAIITNEDPPCICLSKSCKNISPPPNSTMGDCLSTLSSGTECKFQCNSGYSSERTSYCESGIMNISQCLKNTCLCENGIAETENKCLRNKENICKSCNPGYYLTEQKTCSPFMGVCQNGKLAKQGLRIKNNQCEKCNIGYYNDNGTCKQFTICPPGEELQGWSDEKNGNPGKCVPCKPGYYRLKGGFFNTTCQKQDRPCNQNEYEKIKGDSKTKRVCEEKRKCLYPADTNGYIIDKQQSNISLQEGDNFNVVVSCDTANNYKAGSKVGARPCVQNNTEITLFGCKKGCAISKNQYANTGTCKDVLDSGKTCQIKCPTGTSLVNPQISFHQCRNGKLIVAKCSKEARKKLLTEQQKVQEEIQAVEDHMEEYNLVPIQQSSGASVPAPAGAALMKIVVP